MRERRYIIKKVIENLFFNVRSLSNDIASSFGKNVNPNQTVRNVLHSSDIYDRMARKKPFINAKNREKRMSFTKVYLQKSNRILEKYNF